MDIPIENGIQGSIYDSLEALEEYLADVKSRNERRRRLRQERERLRLSVAKVQATLLTVQQDGDSEIIAEIEAVLAEFERRLHALEVPSDSYAVVRGDLLPDASESPDALIVASLPECDREGAEQLPAESAELPAAAATEAVSPLSAEREAELRTLAEGWRDAIHALAAQWRALDTEGLSKPGETLHLPRCLKMRAMACTLGSIHAEARQNEAADRIAAPFQQLRDKMELARSYANDSSECLPFRDDSGVDAASLPNASDWSELAGLYEMTAQAQEAFEWYAGHQELLSIPTSHALLNAIAAPQQMLYRALEDFGGKDRLQADLYVSLRGTVDRAGYLPALNPECAWETLESQSRLLPEMLASAEREAASIAEKRTKEKRKTAAIQAVLDWKEGRGSRAVTDYTLDQDRRELLPLLDACLGAGVPPTNVQVRGALLDIGPRLLDSQEKYAKILEAVRAERRRKGMDQPVEEEAEDDKEEADAPTDSQFEQSLEYVRLFTEGQKILMLGGVPKPHIVQELEQTLPAAEVKWPESKKGDKASKFQADIKRADIILVIKNFVSHEIGEKGRDWCRANNSHFLLLPGGYGVRQIIHQMYQYATRVEGSPRLAAG